MSIILFIFISYISIFHICLMRDVLLLLSTCNPLSNDVYIKYL